MSRLHQPIKEVPDGHGNLLPICEDCFSGNHEHLEFLEGRARVLAFLQVEDTGSPRYALRRILDCKNVNEQNTMQCCCTVGVP